MVQAGHALAIVGGGALGLVAAVSCCAVCACRRRRRRAAHGAVRHILDVVPPPTPDEDLELGGHGAEDGGGGHGAEEGGGHGPEDGGGRGRELERVASPSRRSHSAPPEIGPRGSGQASGGELPPPPTPSIHLVFDKEGQGRWIHRRRRD
jgi:hypothetical protein